jgi:hypothetical protein
MAIKNYFLDDKVITLLFNVEEKDKLEEFINRFQDLTMKVYVQLAIDFLISNGIEEQVAKDYFVDVTEVINPNILQLLQTPEFLTIIRENTNQFYKSIIDAQIPNMKKEKVDELMEYMSSVQTNIDETNALVDNYTSGIKEVSEVIASENISEDELREYVTQEVEKTFNELETEEEGLKVEEGSEPNPGLANTETVNPTTEVSQTTQSSENPQSSEGSFEQVSGDQTA